MSSKTSTRSGWLDSVPDKWSVVPSKAAFIERRQRSKSDDLHLTPSQKFGVLPQEDYMRVTGTKVVLNLSGQANMKHVEPDDFIIHLRSFQGGIERSTVEGKVSMAYTVLTPRSYLVFPGYYRWLLKADSFIQELQSTTDQLRDGQSIKYATFAKIRLPLPPRDVQRAIADYLDQETAQIDAMVAKQEEFIGLLQERRSAAAESAVASIEPRGPRLKHFTLTYRQGWSPQCHAWPADGIERWAVLKAGAVNGGVFRPKENKELPSEVAPRPETVVKVGDLVVSRANTKELVGSASVVAGDYPRLMLSDKLYAFELDRRKAIPEFVATILGSRRWRDLIEMEASGASSSMQNISQADIENLPMLLPPVEDQQRLLNDLDQRTSRIDALITKAEEHIALAKERRSALITAAVTGQIAVRTARKAS